MSESDLPIDIHYDKFIDWLTSRRKIAAKWQDSVRVMRDKISAALAELPDVPEITSVLQNTYINYFHCQEIFSMLEKIESESGGRLKNLFGRYTSKHLKTWNEILTEYRQDNVYLAEAGRILVQNVQYEIPAVKKQISEGERQILELKRKKTNTEKSIVTFHQKFVESCQKLGIQGEDIRSEVVKYGKQFDQVALELVDMIKSDKFRDAMTFYKDFLVYTLVQSFGPRHDVSSATSRLPTLSALREMKHGDDDDDEDEKKESAPAPSINWDLDDGGDMPAFSSDMGGVDFGADSGVSINWGDDSGGGFSSASLDLSAGPSINWGDDAADAAPAINWDLDAGADEGATIHGKTRGLKDAHTRHNFQAELLELEAFFVTRLNELIAPDAASFPIQYVGAPLHIQQESVSVIRSYVNLIQDILTLFKAPRTQQLILIRNSPKYVDRLVSSLEQQKGASKKLEKMAVTLDERIAVNIETVTKLRPQLAALLSQTKTLQKHIQQEVSKQYDGRRVNIIGEINNL
eukprot:TRINITY_DN8175_c0_g1_i9.p1 TRINITY_DN8175_c0_g1~~TRINITY_DN8175_c0_g1_i9.p1  ORF type:complete len:519 (-),score=138.24 TRINITY_DN8175_c0_g1_i9:67-1623(-)